MGPRRALASGLPFCPADVPDSSTDSTSRMNPKLTTKFSNSRGVRIFVDPFSVQYLESVEIDYTTSMMGSGFTSEIRMRRGDVGAEAPLQPEPHI